MNKNQIKVLHVINGEFFSGAERVQDVLALRLPDYGYDVGFVCLKPLKFSVCRQSTGPLYDVPMRSKFDFAPVWEIVRIVKQEGYMILHSHTPRSLMIARLASFFSGVPLVHHVHSPTIRDTESMWRNRINAVIEWLSLAGIARLVPVSRSLENYLKQQGWLARQIRMVANGVVTPGPLLDRAIPGSEWIIGSVALFRPRKGMEVLIQAFAKLCHRGLPVRLRAVGPFETVEYEMFIKSMAADLGVADKIDWIGFVQDVNKEFLEMDVLVLPSLFGEGMPMVILEAMANGVPVVATNVEGIPEVIKHGETGLVVPAGDSEQLAHELQSMICGEFNWRAIRVDAYRLQVTNFSDHSMAKGVAQIYDETLAT